MKQLLIAIFSRFFPIFFSVTLFFAININSQAEIVNVQKEEKKFGDWKTFCEIDIMMDIAHCKIGTKFYDEVSSITIEPNLKSFNQILIVIPKIKNGTFLQIRIDKNDLIFSKVSNIKDFGLITVDDEQKQIFYNQILKGNFLFLRFTSQDSNQEITAKINLKDFRDALAYYKQRN